ncbi:MAG TPA: AAA family ATPase, partial [Longimicrobiales bacterium]|nr:AAA family ATPase [Longimicrobiales bacterium]
MAVFVGRERELAQLRRRLGEADAGRGRAIFITGEPGAGKSSLVARVLEEASALTPTFRFVSATCSEQYGAGEPYQPFVEAFRSLVAPDERSTSKWQNLRDIAAEVAPHWLGAIPVAGGVLSATLSTAAELRRGGTAVAAPNEEAIFFQYTEMFFAAAAQTPIVLVLDDLHWADRASVSLLAHLARRIGNERVLILGTYRPADVDLSRHPIREARLELERYGVAE